MIVCISDAEESLIVESKIIKQEYNREEINRIKLRLAEIEKNQKYILETLSQGNYKKSYGQPNHDLGGIEEKLDQIIQSQQKIYTNLEALEKYTKKQLFLQTMIQFVIFAIFFVFMILIYRYKKETNIIETKIDNVSTQIETNKKETIKILMEKAKEDPRIAEAVKSIIEEENSK